MNKHLKKWGKLAINFVDIVITLLYGNNIMYGKEYNYYEENNV